MVFFLVKTLTSAVIIATISEISRRYTLAAATLASLPLTSILAFTWIYLEHRDPQQIITLSYSVFWLVLPSLLFFLILPWLIKSGMHFGWAMPLACVCMALGYGAFIYLQKHWGTHG